MALTMEHAAVHEKPIMARLLQLYLHDFSEFAEVGSPFGEIGADGTFGYWHFDSYWTDLRREPLFARYNGQIIGFTLVNARSATGMPVDYCIAEFFILRKYRRTGLGQQMAREVILKRPGTWEVPIAAYNEPSLNFWRKAVATVPGRQFYEVDGDGRHWVGKIMRSD